MSAVSKRCSSCGAIRNADDLYCGNCGEPISDSTSTFVKVSQGPDSVHSSGTTILASFETTTPGVQDQKVSPTTKLQRPAFMIAAIIISLFAIILLICSFFFPTVSLFFQLGILLSIVIFIFELVHAGYLEQWYWVIVILLLSPLAGILYDIFNSTSPTMNSVWVVGLLLLTPLGGIIYNTFGPTRKSSLVISVMLFKLIILTLSALGLAVFLVAIIFNIQWAIYVSIEFMAAGYIFTIVHLARLKQGSWLLGIAIASGMTFLLAAPFVGLAYSIFGPTTAKESWDF